MVVGMALMHSLWSERVADHLLRTVFLTLHATEKTTMFRENTLALFLYKWGVGLPGSQGQDSLWIGWPHPNYSCQGSTGGNALSGDPVRDCRFPGLNQCMLNVIHIWVIVKWGFHNGHKSPKMFSSFVMRSHSGKPRNWNASYFRPTYLPVIYFDKGHCHSTHNESRSQAVCLEAPSISQRPLSPHSFIFSSFLVTSFRIVWLWSICCFT